MNVIAKIIFIAIPMLSFSTFASVGKVIKVQGNRAIVEFPKGTTVTTGTPLTTGETSSDESSSSSASGDGKAKRDYGISYYFASGSATAGATTTSTTQLTSAFFINFSRFEIAPILNYTSTGANSSTLGVGVLGQFDFIPNKPGKSFIPGVYLKAVSNSNTLGSTTSSLTYMGGGFSLDWFPFSDHAAFNLGLDYYTYTTAANVNVSVTSLTSGLKAYW